MRAYPRTWRAAIAGALAVGIAATASACASGSSGQSSGSATKAADYSLKMGMGYEPSTAYPLSKVLPYFVSQVSRLTNGHVKVTFFGNSVLGTVQSMINQVQDGSLDMEDFTTGSQGGIIPKLDLFNMPYLASSEDQMWELYTSPLAKSIATSGKGVRVLYYLDTGGNDLISKKPVKSLADLRGMKVRVQNDTVTVATLKALGATPVPLEQTQEYSALQQGVVGGATAALSGFLAAKLQEIAKNVTLLNYNYNVHVGIISNDTLQKLPAAYQKAVIKAGQLTQAYAHSLWNGVTAKNSAALEQAGVKIYTPTAAQYAQFSQLARKIYPHLAGGVGQSTLDQAEAIIKQAQ